MPTLVDLCGLRSPAHDFEGKSLVPLLFYDEREPDRAVFAETNWPTPLRAMVQGKHKLVYDLRSNLYQLYDLASDPGERRNLAGRKPAELSRLQATMWDWLARAVFRRTRANQAEMVRAQDILDRLPPGASLAQATFDQAIHLEGFELDASEARSPSRLTLVAYFRAPHGTKARYRFHARVELVGGDGRAPIGAREIRSPLGGFYPTPVWKPDEVIRERFTLKIPPRWKGDFEVRLGVENEAGQLVPASGEGIVGPWVRLAAGRLR